MEGPGHFLSLKVMRVSRPALASAWQPFFSSSPSFSAHSTASVLSLQGKAPLPGHPKTLRDLTHASELLTLPSSFGSIQLGETFSSCLCVNNEANVDIEAVNLKVEMQTASSKHILADLGGPSHRLAAGETMESIVHHEIKELGQHVLACTITYRLPPNARHIPGSAEDANDPNLQSFRKFYKFAVTNPLSVKTKVHTPRSPSGTLSPTERHKVFLEVHIQNLTQDSMWFERMRFECAEGWRVDYTDTLDDSTKEGLFTGSSALMQPQDMRQYIYILNPLTLPSFPINHAPGTIIPLGRLDISWRSGYGEPGRLLTSMLSRRIPLLALVQQPASALPLYLQKAPGPPTVTPPRVRSPSIAPSRPGTPPAGPAPYRPASPAPYRRPMSVPARPQSPSASSFAAFSPTSTAPPLPPLTPTPIPNPVLEIDADICATHVDRESITVEKPFNIKVALTVSAAVPRDGKERVVSLVVQHLQPPRPPPPGPVVAPEAFSPRLPSSGFSTPSPTMTPSRGTFNYALAEQKLLVASPRQQVDSGWDAEQQTNDGGAVTLPPPFLERKEGQQVALQGVVFLGTSTIFLDPITLSAQSGSPSGFESTPAKAEAVREFELTYLPLRKGFVTAGGLRILLVEDKVDDGDDDGASTLVDGRRDDTGSQRQSDVRTLKEWDIIGEFWVNT
ncbi:hypothetical protein PLICRDRAFT_138993 [Plicaturopsis crispa FD-325 SS-3]|nr:hypothetical protein PLICRDRAFT_138993 [Plicaturopsis crispa FD-325 SS-3]